jgi:hypothetical protein
VLAQDPAVGVKVYTPVDRLLMIEGYQVPVMALLEAAGNNGAVAPKQKGEIAVKLGVAIVLTRMGRVTEVAHSPVPLGVKT